VHHVLVKGSPTAAPGDTPGLSTKHFAKGKTLIVFAQRNDEKKLLCYDERNGALPSTDKAIRHIEALIAR
jgi:hypothetical protein